jgi:site-specific DNA-methyltransferase (adenine-specific)
MPAEYLLANQPDILEVIANLSNDAVFTPPRVVNAVLDLLPAEVWTDPSLRWLDPGAKTGVFPREITKRLMVGLADAIPDEEARLEHILKEMVFAIATEEITGMMTRRSLYCSKDASSVHSVADFDGPDGNVWWKRVKHSWDGEGKCSECRGNREQLLQPGIDNKAYGLIHADGRKMLEKEMNMQFDVVVGNPPYQMDSGGHGSQALPIYQMFVDAAIALNPRYISFIVPSRWMAGGFGLSDFRGAMLSDKRLRKLVDFPDSGDVFPGVQIKGGVCYFLWDRDNPGTCSCSLIRGGAVVESKDRQLDEYDVFVRDAKALEILRKVRARTSATVVDLVSGVQPFGIPSNFTKFRDVKKNDDDLELFMMQANKRVTKWIAADDVPRASHLIGSWKVLVPEAYGAGEATPHQILGQPVIAGEGSVCSHSYICIGPFFSRQEAQSFESYLRTRFFRFLVSLRKITQHAARGTYEWVPLQSWDRTWTDEELYEKYGVTPDEQAYIESIVKEMAA